MRTLAFLYLAVAVAGCAAGEDVGASRAELRDLDSYERGFLELLNEYRQANGLSAVMAERALNDGAYQYSQLMGETNWFDHEGPDGSSFDERMCAAGYAPGCGPRTWVAENIAAGQRSAAEVFEAWRTSPGHNANMLAEEAVVVGIGRAEVAGSSYGIYWTNTFGGQTTANAVPNEEPDAGPPPTPDAGPMPEPDAGPTPVPPLDEDGGLVTGDAGVGPGDPGDTIVPRGRRDRGCSASGAPASELPLAALLALVTLALRRRQRS